MRKIGLMWGWWKWDMGCVVEGGGVGTGGSGNR